MNAEAIVREYGGKIPLELAKQIAAFRAAGDDVVDDDAPIKPKNLSPSDLREIAEALQKISKKESG